MICSKVRSGGVLTDLDYVLFSIYFAAFPDPAGPCDSCQIQSACDSEAICAIWMFLESTLLWPLLDYCPLFVEPSQNYSIKSIVAVLHKDML